MRLSREAREVLDRHFDNSPVWRVVRRVQGWYIRRQWRPLPGYTSGQTVTIHLTSIEVRQGPSVNSKPLYIVTGKVA